MVKLLNKAVDDVIRVIVNSKEYQQCLQLKKEMKKNKELMDLIQKLKDAQKKYVKSAYQDNSEVELLENKLKDIPIYMVYMETLEKVNSMISYVEDDLNDYFYQLFN